ncbi:hypothetical protein GCM10009821_16900 [Aeromicrobium halocynthiae]|uniref:Flp family type IVb pilin n=1 Tax=Aeromicrobium halocynthiae TaxID=560557 RepID=A0ABN2VYX4_9ACTN
MDKLTFALAYMTSVINAPKKDEKGATAVEYGLLVALIAAVIVAIVALLGTQIRAGFTTVLTQLGGTAPA